MPLTRETVHVLRSGRDVTASLQFASHSTDSVGTRSSTANDGIQRKVWVELVCMAYPSASLSSLRRCVAASLLCPLCVTMCLSVSFCPPHAFPPLLCFASVLCSSLRCGCPSAAQRFASRWRLLAQQVPPRQSPPELAPPPSPRPARPASAAAAFPVRPHASARGASPQPWVLNACALWSWSRRATACCASLHARVANDDDVDAAWIAPSHAHSRALQQRNALPFRNDGFPRRSAGGTTTRWCSPICWPACRGGGQVRRVALL